MFSKVAIIENKVSENLEDNKYNAASDSVYNMFPPKTALRSVLSARDSRGQKNAFSRPYKSRTKCVKICFNIYEAQPPWWNNTTSPPVVVLASSQLTLVRAIFLPSRPSYQINPSLTSTKKNELNACQNLRHIGKGE